MWVLKMHNSGIVYGEYNTRIVLFQYLSLRNIKMGFFFKTLFLFNKRSSQNLNTRSHTITLLDSFKSETFSLQILANMWNSFQDNSFQYTVSQTHFSQHQECIEAWYPALPWPILDTS